MTLYQLRLIDLRSYKLASRAALGCVVDAILFGAVAAFAFPDAEVRIDVATWEDCDGGVEPEQIDVPDPYPMTVR
jgi:hypothetical protein